MIRVLLIPSSDYLGHPFPQRHNHIFERINDDKDFEVHVVRFNIFGKDNLSSNCIIHEIPLEFRVKSTPLYYLSNAVSHLREILRIIKNESINVVVAGNLLPPLLLKLYDATSNLKVPFLFDLQDYYPTSATGYVCNANSLWGAFVRGIFESITQELLKRADAVTVPGIALAMYARSVRGTLGASKVYIVPNGISEHFFIKHDGRSIREKFGYTEDDLVVGYIGSIEFWLDMKTLIKALSKAHQDGLKVKFMLVGGALQTSYVKKVAEWIKRYRIEKITDWIDFVRHDEVPKYVAAMNFGTIPFDVTNPTAYYASPNKMWEYLSQEIEVISTPIPESLVHKHLINIVGTEEDYLAVLRNARVRRDNYRQEVRKYLEERTWSRSAKLFKGIIRNLVRSKR